MAAGDLETLTLPLPRLGLTIPSSPRSSLSIRARELGLGLGPLPKFPSLRVSRPAGRIRRRINGALWPASSRRRPLRARVCSLLCDFKMFVLMLAGLLDKEIKRLGKRPVLQAFDLVIVGAIPDNVNEKFIGLVTSRDEIPDLLKVLAGLLMADKADRRNYKLSNDDELQIW